LRFVVAPDGIRHVFSDLDDTRLLCGRAPEPSWARSNTAEEALVPNQACQLCWFIMSFSHYEQAAAIVR
jgi:hypothetical protein